MKTYKGERTIDGIVVTVDGTPLDQYLEVKEFTDQGFEWAYVGNEPRQLALALLIDHGLGSEHAVKLSEQYMTLVTSKLENAWSLTSAEIDTVLSTID